MPATIAQLQSLADHAKMSHRHWLLSARQGSYSPAYCLEGAAIWRRRTAQILAAIRAKRAAAAKGAETRRLRQIEAGARIRAVQDRGLAAAA